MGGSFDPVHSGHLIIAQDAAERFGLTKVIFIPALIPPHKQHVEQADASHRLAMLKLAVDQNPLYTVSDLEIKRGGISYSVDTVSALLASDPDAEIVLIIGSDTLIDLENWYKVDHLLELCEVASFLRPGVADLNEICKAVKLPENKKERLLRNVFKTHLIDISSSEIRERVVQGKSIRYLLPEVVEKYIYEHGLYKASEEL